MKLALLDEMDLSHKKRDHPTDSLVFISCIKTSQGIFDFFYVCRTSGWMPPRWEAKMAVNLSEENMA